jgi:glutamyl-tRNA synthetase
MNFLALLGWSYDDKTTIMHRHELIERFSLERVVAGPATFDYQKLDWMNGVYLRELPPEEYALVLCRYLREQGYEWPENRVRATVPLVQAKIEKLSQYPAYAGFFFELVNPDGADPAICRAAHDVLSRVEPWEASRIEDALRGLADEIGEKPRQAFAPVRLAVTGSNVSPGLFESLELLGKDESLNRLARAAGAGE